MSDFGVSADHKITGIDPIGFAQLTNPGVGSTIGVSRLNLQAMQTVNLQLASGFEKPFLTQSAGVF